MFMERTNSKKIGKREKRKTITNIWNKNPISIGRKQQHMQYIKFMSKMLNRIFLAPKENPKQVHRDTRPTFIIGDQIFIYFHVFFSFWTLQAYWTSLCHFFSTICVHCAVCVYVIITSYTLHIYKNPFAHWLSFEKILENTINYSTYHKKQSN